MFKNLQKATLIKRYKRFLADVRLDNGETLTIYCPNTGAMTGCAEPGDEVYFSKSDNLKRKYQFTWELTHTKTGHWICIHSQLANKMVAEALEAQQIPALLGYETVKAEVKYGSENSRIDFLLTAVDQPDCYVEVKSCTLLDESFAAGQGFFPDTTSVRGQKHLRELMEMKALGFRAVLVFAVLHSGIRSVKAAAHIDKKYASLFEQAKQAGVEVICYHAPLNTPET
ncbi:sugar fermentation stimulation protein [Psychromonas marina]|uniref:Sugar fermentation stimulation protein homolog n=1 Tax=Psychromonas marina TaxID=88364 RepID=A0ABQ6DY08_9GAMM|nr:DNA/RNA nuclease SfsA [Psychromonas marina]GLS90029.1 sugar fermentation stimulation protein [Psychromonas marina]